MIHCVTEDDRGDYMRFAKDFYTSEAVSHKIPDEYIENTFISFIEGNPFADAYMLSDDGKNVGYAVTAKTYSQEAGGMVMWIEELYILPEYRGKGIGSAAMMYIEGKCVMEGYKRMRLEYTDGNPAEKLYKSMRYKNMEYRQMLKEIKCPT